MFRKVLAAIALCAGLATTVYSTSTTAEEIYTPSGRAYIEVVQLVRANGMLTMEMQFITDEPDYPGETLYSEMSESEILRRVYLDAADRTFLLMWENGVPQMPERLELRPNETGEAGAVVGEWRAVFEAPDHDLSRIRLMFPAIGRIGPFPILDQ